MRDFGQSQSFRLESSPFKSYISPVEQTIVAPATPNGTSALAVIRISGPDTRTVLQKIFSCDAPKSRHAALATARDPETKKPLDSLVYLFYEGPNSYTGEDSAEIFPHGNPLIVRRLVAALCKIPNVRVAHRGEFTKRAFLNGKMDLVQAESVADIIHGRTQSAVENAQKMLSGKFSREIRDLAEKLKQLSARIELDVDFVEEEAEPDVEGWSASVEEIRSRVRNLISRFKSGGSLDRRPRVVLYGLPNAGKSSLLNALLRENRVLVSDIPGTTRDFVEVPLTLPSGDVTLVDTAGIADAAQSDLDRLSMEKSEEALESADLGVLLVDATDLCSEAVRKEVEEARGRGRWVVYSKMDLAENLQVPEWAMGVSAKRNAGLSEFIKRLDSELFPRGAESDEYWITSARACASLQEADACLGRIQKLLGENPAVELVAFEMRGAMNALASITGEISSEDVLQTIFSGFCIGK